jgi:hypothetical protein
MIFLVGYSGVLFGVIPTERAGDGGIFIFLFSYKRTALNNFYTSTSSLSSLTSSLLLLFTSTLDETVKRKNMSLSGKTDNPSFVLRGIHDTVYEDVSRCPERQPKS